jgi:DNA recombination protein RmuC
MLFVVFALQIVLIVALIALFLRKPAAPPQDPRQLQLPDQLTRAEAALQAHTERQLAQIRTDLAAEAASTRAASDLAAAALRTEVLHTIANLGTTLHTGLETFRTDNKSSAETLRATVQQTLETLTQRFSAFNTEQARTQLETQNTLNSKLAELASSNSVHQEKLRATVEASLATLSASNEAKLEQMRATVDEKLHATLHTRLTESFGQVTDQLNKVHTGLGEMSKLSEGVDDLSRIFSNVKSRGGFAEVQLGMLLEQMLAPSQFQRNVCVKPGTQQIVEFAVRFPSNAGETLLPIDAKFPREDWERLESAYAANDPEALAACGRAFEASIRGEAKRICEKYINPPVTTPHAIMFLPTEGLYAEVMRRDALQAEIQSKCQVTIAGPSTLSAILTSFQMGFHMLALQEKGDEVWKVLESTKTEFGKFGKLMDKVEGDVGKIQKTLGEVGVRTRAINRTLREVSDTTTNAPLEFEDFTSTPLRLAAVGDDD